MSLSEELMKILQAEREQAAKDWAEAEQADTRPMFFASQPQPIPGTEYYFQDAQIGSGAAATVLSLPDSNPKTVHGTKKPSFHCIPPAALVYLGAVMKNGADKYGVMNWREHAVTFSVYYNAAMRHLFAILDGEWLDPESGQPHAAHVMACMTVILDAKENGKLNDDRPSVHGQAAKMVRPK